MSNTLYALLILSVKIIEEFYLSFHLQFTSAFDNVVIMPDENLCKEKFKRSEISSKFQEKKIV